MRRLKQAIVVIATGEILCAATSSFAQPKAVGPVAAAQDTSEPQGAAGNAKSSGLESKTSPQVVVPNGASANPLASVAGSSSGAGYTWHDKPSRGKYYKSHSTKVNPSLTQAKGPRFAVATDGTSRISVQLSRRVDVHAHGNLRRYIYDLQNVQVAVANDMNPLITTHFATPLKDARLIALKQGARLIVDLRENVTPQYSTKDVADGGMILEVVLPMSVRKISVATDAQQHLGRTKPKSATESRDSKDRSVVPQNGVGPRL